MSYITIAGHKIQFDENVYTLPCLGGEDVSRHTSHICVMARDGQLVLARDESVLRPQPGDTLRGWGKLDGCSYRVAGINVPMSLLDGVAAHARVRLETWDADVRKLADEHEEACYEDKGEAAFGRED